MNVALTILAAVIWAALAVIWIRRSREKRAFARLSITPQALHDLLNAKHDVAILDVRQPLDLLADSEMIEGAIRVAPQDAEKDPSLIPLDKELVVYCTCPSDKTSRAIAMRAESVAPNINISRIRFLQGGLAAWKAGGFPVVPYNKTFRLDTGT